MPISPSHIVQIAVPIQDLARAKRFYGETLGLTHLFDAPPSLAFYQCGETRLMLSPPSEEEVAKASILYYSVPDARAAETALAGDGGEIVTPAHFLARVGGRDIWLAIARDSEGNLLGLMSEQESAG
jgi:methylmalonyl-CoA/ethylmalonyl-CoA epimerase